MSADVEMTEASTKDSTQVRSSDNTMDIYITGWRLHCLTFALMLSLFIATLEVSIVSTSLVTITNDLHAFGSSTWIVIAYLLTYTGFLIIWAKASNLFGRKLIVCVSVLIFVVFSGACGAAQTITQLIVFRVFQGLGGSGIYSLVMVFIPEMVPESKFAAYSSLVSVVFASAYLLGPLLKGLIDNKGAWRWIFLLNVPSGITALVLLVLSVPTGFPNHMERKQNTEGTNRAREIQNKMDLVGASLLLAASTLLISAIEETGTGFSWSSPMIIIFFIISALAWVGLIGWSWIIQYKQKAVEPIFTWRFIKNRVFIGALINSFLSGIPFTVAVIEIPQRFQAVKATSPLLAGVRLLPFSLSAPFGSALFSVFITKLKMPPAIVVILGAVFQIVGAVLLSTLPVHRETIPATYGYEVILGIGVGLNIATLMVLPPYVVEKRDQAVAMGAVVQFRIMSGAVGLAIATSVLNSYVKSHLAVSVSSQQLGSVLQSADAIEMLDSTIQSTVRAAFGRGYNLQMKIMIGFGAAQIPASFLMWGNHIKVAR